MFLPLPTDEAKENAMEAKTPGGIRIERRDYLIEIQASR